MKKKILASFLLTCFLLSQFASAVTYRDVSENHWAYASIQKASSAGLMQGTGSGTFGLGTNIQRSAFAAMLCRMFGWSKVSPQKPTFTDNANRSAWYYSDIETAAAHGALDVASGRFRPNAAITREEIAVMLTRALGYSSLESSVSGFGMPFTDVTTNKGAIAMAYDFGIITGTSANTFNPKGTAKREEAAAMMVRAYEKYTHKLDWLHGFYAISSWGQKDVARSMNAVSLGWSRLEFTNGYLMLNTTSANHNEWNIPEGSQSARDFLSANGTSANLSVFMNTNQKEILLSEANRETAAESIAAELSQGQYSGITIDFEGMKGNELKTAFTAFLTVLRQKIGTKPLYVAVHPRAKNGGACFDAYDYRAIGNLADKVILMAHDFQPTSMSDDMKNAGYTVTPVTPFDDVYYALKAITNPSTGVQDKSKIALAISFSSCGWSLKGGKVINTTPMKPSTEQIYNRLKNTSTKITYSARYRNPSMTYYDSSDSTDNVVWYEDSQSVTDKIKLARMFGINGISLWRIGTIPAYNSYNVWNSILSQK